MAKEGSVAPKERINVTFWTSPMKDRTPFPPYDKG